ncbi:hypothetical protein [Marinobacter sp. SS13-12]|uniref:hypothetical protein n=1 Tax=Marinobacter sp. SS13-12 TaxID=3050451 RepID=UPI0025563EFA|nr:hypothetical protein [Marinobacter sp. SS13-12]MDK8462390.1 hypothetical protein [Marinobacter sp. SS13-12]
MRHSCIFAAVPLLAVFLAGCGPDSSSGSNFHNPAASVSLSFESFELSNEEGLPEVLPQTLFHDFYRGLEPADGESDESADVTAQLRGRLDLLMGLTPSDDGTSYTSARNPLDFLRHVIASNQVNNFDVGRQLMRDSMDRGEPATYNTRSNNALIRFTETGGNNGADPEPDQRWIYPLLDWTSAPQSDRIFSAIQFIARAPNDDDPNPPELLSLGWSAQYANKGFSASGYNQPEFAATSMTGRELGNIEFFQVFTGEQSGTLVLKQTSGITLNGQEPSYICAELDYQQSTVSVFYFSGTPEGSSEETGTDTNPNPVECLKGESEPIVYNTVPIEQRQ